MCFVRQWAASTSSPAPAAGQDVVSGHVGELQPAVAVKFVTPPAPGEQRQIIKVTSATILACDCHCAHCATGDTGARSGGDTPHTSGHGEDSTQGQCQGMGTAVGGGAASLLCQCPVPVPVPVPTQHLTYLVFSQQQRRAAVSWPGHVGSPRPPRPPVAHTAAIVPDLY